MRATSDAWSVPLRATSIRHSRLTSLSAQLDRRDAREAVNAFCRRYLIPLIDIGMEIRSTGEHLASADGQMIVNLPGESCMRCWFLTDADLAAERKEMPAGYDRNPDASGDPQVVSMNGGL